MDFFGFPADLHRSSLQLQVFPDSRVRRRFQTIADRNPRP
jgi:hypothetical protein